MKNTFLLIVTTVSAIFSLQSCVTNYVAASPAAQLKEYKIDAKTSTTATAMLEADKKTLIASFASERVARMDAAAKADRNAEIAKTIKLSKTIDGILDEAYTYLGTPYRYGGTTRNGIDCSAFVLSVFGASAGVHLPRVAADQSQEGESVQKSDLQKGDLIFFSHGGGRIAHVGIVENVTPEGEVKFIHAATSRGVMVSSLNDSYWGPRYRMAKRIVTNHTIEASEGFAKNL